MFEGFERRQIETSDTTINLVMGGDGPPLLLLHGYPQTHVMWHKIAPGLARRFTVDFRYPPAEPHIRLNVRLGSKADLFRLPCECPLSGVKRT